MFSMQELLVIFFTRWGLFLLLTAEPESVIRGLQKTKIQVRRIISPLMTVSGKISNIQRYLQLRGNHQRPIKVPSLYNNRVICLLLCNSDSQVIEFLLSKATLCLVWIEFHRTVKYFGKLKQLPMDKCLSTKLNYCCCTSVV